jgi:hypothetical protein
MALTPEEEKELAMLEAAEASGLTPEEQAELAQLEAEVGEAPTAPQQGAWETFKNFAGAVGDAGARGVTMGYLNTPEMQENIKKSPAGEVVGGVVGGAVPAMALSPVSAGASKLLGAGRAARVAGGGAQAGLEGLLRKPGEGESRVDNAKEAAGLAALFGGGIEAFDAARSVGKKALGWAGGKIAGLRPKEASAYTRAPGYSEELARQNREDPMGLSRRVKNTIKGDLDQSFERVAQPTLDKVGKAVAGKSARIRTDQFQGTAAGDEFKRAWDAQGNVKRLDVPTAEVVRSSPLKYSIDRTGPSEIIQPEVSMTPVKNKIRKAGKVQTLQPEISMTPVEESLKYGKPLEQIPPHDPAAFGYEPPVASTATVSRSLGRSGKDVTLTPAIRMTPVENRIVRAGKTEVIQPEVQMTPVKTSINPAHGKKETLEELLLTDPKKALKQAQVESFVPRGSQEIGVPTPMPDEMSVTGPQLLRGKRASQKAANFSSPGALNPQEYAARAEAEAAAASKARKALESIAPETVPLNDILEESARYSTHAKEALKNNPAAILTDSDSLGSVPKRSMRQFLDKHGGSDLEGMANALAAGDAMTDPNRITGIKDRIGRAIGGSLMRQSGAPKSSPADYNSLAAILAAIAKSKQEGEE